MLRPKNKNLFHTKQRHILCMYIRRRHSTAFSWPGRSSWRIWFTVPGATQLPNFQSTVNQHVIGSNYEYLIWTSINREFCLYAMQTLIWELSQWNLANVFYVPFFIKYSVKISSKSDDYNIKKNIWDFLCRLVFLFEFTYQFQLK